MKRRNAQERDEATAHEQAEARREALLAELKAREAAARPAAAAALPEAPTEAVPAGDDAVEPTEPE